LETPEEVMTTLLRLHPSTHGYHERKREEHGELYLLVETHASGDLISARSLATGMLCLLDVDFVEAAPDGT
jgi:hypothetical protein